MKVAAQQLGSQPSSAPPRWTLTTRHLTDWLSRDCLGGPRPWKLAWVINIQKAGTFPFYLLLVWWYQNTTTPVLVYVALQAAYGLAWVLKDVAFPDRNWQARITILGGINTFATVLGPYWVFGWLLISRTSVPTYPLPEAQWLCLCVGLTVLGVVIMIAADAQKFFTLRVRPGLITDGMFRWVRHPNYLGEMMF